MNRGYLSIIITIVFLLLTCAACSMDEMMNNPDENKMGVITFGNTSGNHANDGIVAVQGDWAYIIIENYPGSYSNLICKRRLDGTEETYWSTNAGRYLNVVGDLLFYEDSSSSAVYISQTNGKGNDVEIPNMDLRSGFQVVGEWIYYSSFSGDGFYKIRSNGKQKKKILEDTAYNFYVDSDKIIYWAAKRKNKPMGIYTVNLNGTEEKLLVSGIIICFNADGDWVYYAGASNSVTPDPSNSGIWKVRKDGSENTKIADDVGTINVSEGWIYYTSASDNRCLYKIRTNGTGKTKLNSDATDKINIAGDWIYYQIINKNSPAELYQIRTDGTERQKVQLKNYIPEELPTFYEFN